MICKAFCMIFLKETPKSMLFYVMRIDECGFILEYVILPPYIIYGMMGRDFGKGR